MALNFVAPDDVTLSDNAAYDLGTGATLFIWANSDVGDDGQIRHFLNGDSSTAARWGLLRRGAGGDNEIQATLRNSGGAIIPNGSALAGNALDTSLHCHSSTYDGLTMRLYEDGTQVSSGSDTDSISNITGSVFIGRHPNGVANNAFDGWLEHCAVWNTDLSAVQEAALSRGANPFAMMNSNLVVYIPMYIADGVDWSPTRNDGTSVNTTETRHIKIKPIFTKFFFTYFQRTFEIGFGFIVFFLFEIE